MGACRKSTLAASGSQTVYSHWNRQRASVFKRAHANRVEGQR